MLDFSYAKHHPTRRLRALSFLPGITTSGGNNWRAQLGSLQQLGIREVSFFPTTLGDPTEREELYRQVEEKHHWLSCPAVHLRDDMERCEYEVLQALGAKVFNLHATPRALKFVRDNPDIAETIFVENGSELDEVYFEMLGLCGGACIDLAHLQDFGFLQKFMGYDWLLKMLPDLEIGMTHIAAVWDEPHETPSDRGSGMHMSYEEHFLRAFPEDLEYLMRQEIQDILERCEWNCIELTDTIGQQLAAIKYIERSILGRQ